ncbi:hypothetical protein RJ640_013781 [Escallonia rubra]|uniref:Uncharacterized protein n=1 Tax=Escallonia rubra TaxID=112253 RepID=A0AA88QEP5_9ASTE|nr:hypothetical protein RJ640_013781 [Escallonia rubra]
MRKNPQPWSNDHTNVVRRIKLKVKSLPCFCLPIPEAYKIVETDVPDFGYGGCKAAKDALEKDVELAKYVPFLVQAKSCKAYHGVASNRTSNVNRTTSNVKMVPEWSILYRQEAVLDP